jgi:hypothetical protein
MMSSPWNIQNTISTCNPETTCEKIWSLSGTDERSVTPTIGVDKNNPGMEKTINSIASHLALAKTGIVSVKV